MALRLRRGTEAERITITPQAGELIYVLDTKKVYVGDGLTPGGNPVDTNVGALGIDDLTDVNTSGAVSPVDGEALVWDAGAGEWQPKPVLTLETDPTVNGDLKINIVGSDSTLLVDSDNNIITGIFRGDLTGDVYGSLYADDSTVIVDVINGVINSDLVGNHYGSIRRQSDSSQFLDPETQEFLLKTKGNGDQSFLFTGTDATNETDLVMTSGNRNRLIYIKEDLTQDLSGSTSSYGNIDFRRRDLNGEITTGRISGGKDFIYFFNSDQGLTPGAPPVLPYGNFMFYRNGDLGLGTNLPAAKLDVQGDAIFLGDVQAAAFKGSVVADDSTVIIDAVNNTITAGGFVQFGSYTDSEISNITPANGMVYYNSTDNRFRGYQNGAWINLDDGTAA